jgi:hypothetical protein
VPESLVQLNTSESNQDCEDVTTVIGSMAL